jgi:CheY-like chemotaxis protein
MCRVTYSGHDGLEILRRADSIDLVVTDQATPNMTGTELAKGDARIRLRT